MTIPESPFDVESKCCLFHHGSCTMLSVLLGKLLFKMTRNQVLSGIYQ